MEDRFVADPINACPCVQLWLASSSLVSPAPRLYKSRYVVVVPRSCFPGPRSPEIWQIAFYQSVASSSVRFSTVDSWA